MAFTPWYKDMVVYHIWPRSFCDGNGDGIGDLYGVLYRLDYIKSLGVDAIWFSPLYPSPNADWGYDISDYMDIHPDFGDLKVFKRVLKEAHDRGLRVFMDLVVNHTSDAGGACPPTTGPRSLRARPGSMTPISTNTTCTCLPKSSRT